MPCLFIFWLSKIFYNKKLLCLTEFRQFVNALILLFMQYDCGSLLNNVRYFPAKTSLILIHVISLYSDAFFLLWREHARGGYSSSVYLELHLIKFVERASYFYRTNLLIAVFQLDWFSFPIFEQIELFMDPLSDSTDFFKLDLFLRIELVLCFLDKLGSSNFSQNLTLLVLLEVCNGKQSVDLLIPEKFSPLLLEMRLLKSVSSLRLWVGQTLEQVMPILVNCILLLISSPVFVGFLEFLMAAILLKL